MLFEFLPKGVDNRFTTTFRNMWSVRPETILNHSNCCRRGHLMKSDTGGEIDEGIQEINKRV